MSRRLPKSVSLAALAVAWLLPSCPGHAEEKAPAAKEPAHPTTAPAAGVQKIDVEQFDKLRQEKDHVVLDVRTPQEFAAGHVPGAVNIPVQSSDFAQKVKALDKKKPYLVHCARGGRSAQAVARMEQMGFVNLADFTGGMEAWKKAGKPTTRSVETVEEKAEQKSPQK